jgi:hypothetical protein
MWLNDFGLDIRCVRMHPYISDGKTFLDVQTVIPIPEIADYQVRIREKKQKERESRETARDFTRFDVKIAGQQYSSQSKRWLMFRVISQALKGVGTLLLQRWRVVLLRQQNLRSYESVGRSNT